MLNPCTVNATCRALCDVTVDAGNAGFINERIKEDYSVHWLVDGLPAAETKQDEATGEVFYDMGCVCRSMYVPCRRD